jgi:hypothetical protein
MNRTKLRRLARKFTKFHNDRLAGPVFDAGNALRLEPSREPLLWMQAKTAGPTLM